MEVKSLLGLPEELEVVGGDVTGKMITITAVSTQIAPCCPLCGTSASRIHSLTAVNLQMCHAHKSALA